MISTGFGFWSPLVLVGVFFVVFVVCALFCFLFRRDQARGAQSKPFLAGHEFKEKKVMPASSLYWGFTEALKPFYGLVQPIHTGLVGDYVSWFVVVAAVLLLAFAGVF